MDIHMPEMDGVAATKAIRALADPARAAIPIVALTANAMAGSRETYLAAGMDEYVSKPIDITLLNEVLDGVGGDGGETAPAMARDEPSATETATARRADEPVVKRHDELTKLVGELDQFVDPPAKG